LTVKLEKYSREQNEFRLGFQTHNDIIMRYDEVLCDKASKHYVYERIKELKTEYDPKISKLTCETENLMVET
jgi:hypothetical protein